MPERSWDTGEYLLWLNNSEGPHFGSHRIVAEMLREMQGRGRVTADLTDPAIGRVILVIYPPGGFSASIDPAKVDPAEVGRELREDHADLGYGAQA